MTEIIQTLLLLSASGSILGLVLLIARRASGKRLPSTLWYYAWLPVLLRMVLPLPGLIPQAQTAESAAAAPVYMQEEKAEKRVYRYNDYDAAADSGGAASETSDTAVPAAEPFKAVVEAEAEAEAEPTAAAAPSRVQLRTTLKRPALWLGIWLAGAAIFFARYTAGYMRFRKALMRSLQTTDGHTARVYASFRMEHKPKLFLSAYVATPMLLGLRRPLIVLPDGEYSEEAARNVLRHELTHFRRGDLYVKWLFVVIASLHWFNPLMPLFRRELDRVCELSCDENVLSRMEPSKRHSYGETLLDLAENRALPAGVVATTFAAEKRALKERLEQIMKFNHKPRAIIALTIAALLLMGALALAAAPARASAASSDSREPSPEPTPASSESSAELRTVNVSTVDEFLAAIAPDTAIVLAPGSYDLSKAPNYGKVTDEIGYYRWEEVFDGYELVIEDVSNLSITASSDDPAATVISAVPRYADVLAFNNCDNIELSGFTAGHTVEQGQCAGGVIHLEGSDIVTVENCSLYGCGVLGVQADNCRGILVSDTDIYECSYGAVELTFCRNVQFDRCSFRDCSNRYGELSPAFTLITIDTCYGVAITDGHVYGNYVYELVNARYSQEVCLLGTLFENNTVNNDDMDWYSGAALTAKGDPITVAGCEFRDDCAIYNSGEETVATDMDGNALSYDDLAAMKQEHVDFTGFAALETPELERTLGADGLYEVHVSNVNEFLAAIAPNTTIYMDEGLYDLSKAAAYGGYGGEYYYWVDMFDGLGLVITGAENLSIVGAGKDATRIEALPRYADVIRFEYCANVSVTGVTAGHTLGAGECVGAVLSFRHCVGVNVEECGLFGCGTFGVVAEESKNIAVKGNEIYQCSYGAVQLSICAGADFEDNDIHDCAYPTYGVYDSLDVAIDGSAVAQAALSTLTDYPLYLAQQVRETGSPILQEILDRGEIIFNENIDIPGAGPYKSAAQN